jgi:Lar family restriction alleviation protein
MTLEPCPFCGATDVGMDSYRALGWMGLQYEVRCTDCNASGPNADTEDDAAREWNRRHDPKRHEDQPDA